MSRTNRLLDLLQLLRHRARHFDPYTLSRYRDAAWQTKAKILQTPTKMDFGLTFVAEDPDGHRLRVFAPAANPR